MPSAGSSFLIDSLIQMTPSHQRETFKNAEILSECREPGNSHHIHVNYTEKRIHTATKCELETSKTLQPIMGSPKGSLTEAGAIGNNQPWHLKSMEKIRLPENNMIKEMPGQHEPKHFNGISSEKPKQSYIALISRAILSSSEKRLQLSDIYRWIMENYPYYHNQNKSWRNSVRHNLSLNECFIKAGRSDNGKGHYWAVHPANIEAFSRGDYQRRTARRRVHRAFTVTGCHPQFSLWDLHSFQQRFCICCHPLYFQSNFTQVFPLIQPTLQRTREALCMALPYT